MLNPFPSLLLLSRLLMRERERERERERATVIEEEGDGGREGERGLPVAISYWYA